MDRWQIAAVVVAAALLGVALLYRPQAPPPPRPTPASAAREAPVPAPERAPDRAEPAPMRVEPEQPRIAEKLLTLHNDAVEIRVSSVGLRVDGVELPGYKATTEANSGPVELVTSPSYGAMKLFLGPEPLKSLELAPAEVTVSDPLRVELRAALDGVVVTRRLELDESGYGGRLVVAIENGSSVPIRPALELVFYGQERPADAADHFPHYSVVASVDGSINRMPLAGIGSAGWGALLGKGPPTGTAHPAPVDWAGTDSQYFLLAAAPQNPQEASVFLGPLGTDLGDSALKLAPVELPPGTGLERSYRLYLGPKIEEAVIAVDPKLATSIDAGWAWVRPVVFAFGGMLRWTHDHVVPNYGIAIILLTILVRLVTYPLTQRQMASMKRFSSIAPQMKEIQEKYANDREKMQAELAKIYTQTGINPLTAMGGGCVPMLIQMPVMFALYFALQTSIELRHAPFVLWIRDLSAPENFFSVGGIPIRLLPLLMGGSMLLQQRLSPAPNADPQQRQMMTLMSVMFTFMFYQFPAGLVLYWFVSNLLGIGQQLIVNRTPATAPATTSEKPA